jgi:hypothetical protein
MKGMELREFLRVRTFPALAVRPGIFPVLGLEMKNAS